MYFVDVNMLIEQAIQESTYHVSDLLHRCVYRLVSGAFGSLERALSFCCSDPNLVLTHKKTLSEKPSFLRE